MNVIDAAMAKQHKKLHDKKAAPPEEEHVILSGLYGEPNSADTGEGAVQTQIRHCHKNLLKKRSPPVRP